MGVTRALLIDFPLPGTIPALNYSISDSLLFRSAKSSVCSVPIILIQCSQQFAVFRSHLLIATQHGAVIMVFLMNTRDLARAADQK